VNRTVLPPKDTIQKHPDSTAKAIVYKKKNDKGQDKNPKHANKNFQNLENQPQQDQSSYKNGYRIL
jgi:hypothetical protein